MPGLTKRHTSHGIKHGVVDDLAHNPLVNIVCIVCRANWDYSGEVSSKSQTVLCCFNASNLISIAGYAFFLCY